MKNEVNKNKKKDKGSRCDYVAKLGDMYINIEVNNNSSLAILQRNMQYVDGIFSRKRKEGSQDKTEEYNYIIQVNINNFAFQGNEKIIDIYVKK